MTQSAVPARLLYLDDLAMGQRFVSASRSLDAKQITDFARFFDPQPFHVDEAAARASFFEGLAASGWHTASISMRLTVESLPIAGGLIGAGGEISWPRPTRPGDVLTVHIEVIDIRVSRSKPDRGIVSVRSETRNQHGDVVQVFVSKLVVPRRPG
jgi:acyl dehydratase